MESRHQIPGGLAGGGENRLKGAGSGDVAVAATVRSLAVIATGTLTPCSKIDVLLTHHGWTPRVITHINTVEHRRASVLRTGVLPQGKFQRLRTLFQTLRLEK